VFWLLKKFGNLIVRPRRRRGGQNDEVQRAIARSLAVAVDELRECELRADERIRPGNAYWHAIMQIGLAGFSRKPKDVASARKQIDQIQDPFWRAKARKKMDAALSR